MSLIVLWHTLTNIVDSNVVYMAGLQFSKFTEPTYPWLPIQCWDGGYDNHERGHRREASRKVTKNVENVDLGLSIPL